LGLQYRFVYNVWGCSAADLQARYFSSLLDQFYPAERYHQNYATLHPDSSYIARFDLPKIGNLKAMFPALYRNDPVLVSQ
jgi:hypothetical protein